jgi:hypothetical protein
VTFGAVLDANVLVPVALADTLLGAAEAGLYRPLWSGRILAEVRAAILRVHPELDPSRIDARLHAVSVDDFLLDLADLNRPAMARVIWAQAAAKSRPPKPPTQILDALSRAGAAGCALSMRSPTG